MSLATWVRFSQGAETFFRPLAILRGTEPVSALTLTLLYCCSLYKQSRADRVNHPVSSQIFMLHKEWMQISFQGNKFNGKMTGINNCGL